MVRRFSSGMAPSSPFGEMDAAWFSRAEMQGLTQGIEYARSLMAPEVFGLDTRTHFRNQAEELLEELPPRAGVLVVDFARTRRIDSAGLGVLMTVQRLVAEREGRMKLRNLKDEFR